MSEPTKSLGIVVSVKMDFDFEEMARLLTREQIAAVMAGLAMVAAAQKL